MATNITELTAINESNDFNTLKNKSILWDLMYQNGTFNDLSPDKFESVKAVFEKMIQKNNDVRKDTTSKNKQVLIDMTNHIADIKRNNSSTSYDMYPITASEISNQRRAQFESNLSKRRREFDELVQRPVPKEIDFSDKTEDEPLVGNMDKMIEDVMAKRERDFNMVSTTQQPQQPQQPPTLTLQANATKELKIGETIEQTSITPIEPIQNKHVTFSQDTDLQQLHQKILTIEKKQDEMLELLKQMSTRKDE